MATPDRGKRLSDGVLVEAKVVARLLGMRLLKLDAIVTLTPADLSAPADVAPADVESTASPTRPVLGGGPRGGLAEAVRNLHEGADLLAESRRNGGSPGAKA